ncbi:hypothetical protein Y032_0358g3400 [Ancylostoma ceylanicum]|nr:hypothetical protein Y032_0358g3400 [Ancylostoma ceylanicum]
MGLKRSEWSVRQNGANEAYANEKATFMPPRLRAALAWHGNGTAGHAARGKVQYATRTSPKSDGFVRRRPRNGRS